MLVFCGAKNSKWNPLALNKVIRVIRQKATDLYGKEFSKGRNFASVVHSDHIDADQRLSDFKDGKIKILCVVGMALEGFDFSELSVVIDLRPSLKNKRRQVQKLGRACRYMPGKTARYYYSDTVTNYIKIEGHNYTIGVEHEKLLHDQITASLQEDSTYRSLPETEQAMMVEASVKAASSNAIHQHEMDAAESGLVNNPSTAVHKQSVLVEMGTDEERESLKLRGEDVKKVVVTRSSYIVCDAYNANQKVETEYFFDLIDRVLPKKGNLAGELFDRIVSNPSVKPDVK